MTVESPVRRPGPRRPHDGSTRAPLRRKPKQLDAEPVVLDRSPSGGRGSVLRVAGEGGDRRGPVVPGSSAPGTTDEPARVVDPAEADQVRRAVDPVARAQARQIAARLAVPRPRQDRLSRRGSGDLASVPYRGGSDDVDLDRTIEVLAERPVPDDEDIVVRERVRTRRSVVLAVDVSGSMRGERVRTAAATVGALAAELHRDDVAVLAFWSDAAVLLHLGQQVRPLALLDELLALPARGLTNVAFPLQLARTELVRAPARDARVVLLSDCVHNAGPDPRPDAARLGRLDVLLDVSGEHDVDLARDLARAGRGTLARIRTARDVAPAVSRAFAA